MSSGGGASGRTPLVGRQRELDALLDHLAAAGRGAGRAVLIGGEPGIGKTRLLAELTEQARLAGKQVLAGRAYESEGLPPYLPFSEALGSYVRAVAPGTLASLMGSGGAQVAQLVPELSDRSPDLVAAERPSGEFERYWLFEGITEFLAALARSDTGAVLVLDDLHWADAPSLRLLLHLVQRLDRAPLLVVGSYRDTEVDKDHPLAAVLDELSRRWSGEQIRLQGLSLEEAGRYVALTTAAPVSGELVTRLHHDARGNPLFIGELIRLLVADGRLGGADSGRSWLPALPQTVQHIIGRRLDRLSPECGRVLSFAAVLGSRFELAVLARAGDAVGETAGTDRGHLLAALDEAETARLVAVVPNTAGSYGFSHPLVRETLYAQLLTRERVRLHRLAGEALERAYRGDVGPHLAELAHHFVQAAPAGGAEKAVEYAQRAGARAATVFAYEDAARWYETALQVLPFVETAGGAEGVRRCDLLLGLAEARSRAGETVAAKETFLRACDLARELGLVAHQARAALGYGGYRFTPGLIDQVLMGLLEQADTALAGRDDALRARVLARLAMELYSGGERERRDRLSEEAVALARRSGDGAALAAALVGRHYALHGPENVRERLAAAGELIGLAEAAGERELLLQGHYLRVIDALELADVAAVDASIAAHARLSEEVRQPLYLWRTDLLLGMRAMLEGRFGEAGQLVNRAFAVSQQAGIANSLPAFGAQLLALRLEMGGLEALEPEQRRFVERYPAVPVYRAGLAWLYRALEREAEARTEFERLAPEGFAALTPDDNWLPAMACLAEVCSYLNDADRAATLYDRLLPFVDRVVVLNAAIGCLGAVARFLGLLATVIGRWDDAQRHFTDALARNAALGARPAIAHTQHNLASMLLRRAGPGDAEQADALLAQAGATAGSLGMVYLSAAVDRLRDRSVQQPASAALPASQVTDRPAGLSEREVEVLRLLAAGHTNQEIADALVLSSRTVDHHIQAIYRKTGARRRADAAAFALRVGLVPTP